MSRSKLPSGRPRTKRIRRKRYLIACNGKVTEPQYFRFLLSELGRNASGTTTIADRAAGKDPLTLVKDTAQIKKLEDKEAKKEGYDSFETVWAVTDTDDYCLGEAQKTACKEGVSLILSNPCFEVWLIDHIRVCPDSCFPTKECQGYAVKQGVVSSTASGRGKKRMKAICEDALRGRVSAAIKNAKKHNTDEKGLRRKTAVDNTASYAVWTDVTDVVEALAGRRI